MSAPLVGCTEVVYPKKLGTVVDLETLGVKSGCVILGLAAYNFDLAASINPNVFSDEQAMEELVKTCKESGRMYRANISIFESMARGFKADVKTCKWWFERPVESQAKVLANSVSIAEAMEGLRHHIEKQGDIKKVWMWANSPSFDLEILRPYLEAENISLPFFNEMDVRSIRTFFDYRNKVNVTIPMHLPERDALLEAHQMQEAWHELHELRALRKSANSQLGVQE